MKIKFIKRHNKFEKGDVVDVADERAKYWIKVQAAVAVKDEPKADKPAGKRQTKELKTEVKDK